MTQPDDGPRLRRGACALVLLALAAGGATGPAAATAGARHGAGPAAAGPSRPVATTAAAFGEEAARAIEDAVAADPAADAVGLWLLATLFRAARYDEAAALADEWRAREPGRALPHALLGLAALGRDEGSDAAAPAFRRALELEPGHPVAAAYLAGIQAAGGDLDAARATLAGALAADSDHPALLTRAAAIDARLADPAEAEAKLRRAVAARPAAPAPHRALAGLLLDAGRPQEALETAQAGLRIAPADPALTRLAATAQLRSGQVAAARAMLERLVRLHPGDADDLYLLAAVHAAAGDPARQGAALRAALGLDPGHPGAAVALTRHLLRTGAADDAGRLLAALRTAPADAPRPRALLPGDDPTAAVLAELAGRLALLRGRFDEAADELAAAAEAGRPRRDLVLALAEAEFRAGRPERAAAALDGWLEGHPDDPEPAFLRANALLAAGELPAARDAFAALVDRAPRSAVLRNNLAWTLLQLGAPAAALEHAEAAHALAPDDPRMLDLLGLVLLQNDRAAEALPLLRRASAALPGSRDTRYNLARALAATGARADAVDALRAILAAGGGARPAFERREEAEALLRSLGGG